MTEHLATETSYLETNTTESQADDEEEESKLLSLEYSDEKREDIAVEEWRLVALTIDKCLFYVFFLAWVIIHLVFISCSTSKEHYRETLTH